MLLLGDITGVLVHQEQALAATEDLVEILTHIGGLFPLRVDNIVGICARCFQPGVPRAVADVCPIENIPLYIINDLPLLNI